jgi:multiple sugar transport system permease protein
MSPVGAAVAYSILIFWSAIVILPTYWLAIAAFKDAEAVKSDPRYIPFVDFQPTLDVWRFLLNYYPNCNVYDIAMQLPVMICNAAAYVLSPLVHIDPMEPQICRIWQAVTNSLIVSISATALSIIVGSMACPGIFQQPLHLRCFSFWPAAWANISRQLLAMEPYCSG